MNIKLKRNEGAKLTMVSRAGSRLWPRGIKENLHADEWAKTITEVQKSISIRSSTTVCIRLMKPLLNGKKLDQSTVTPAFLGQRHCNNAVVLKEWSKL